MQMWFFRHERQDGFLIRPFGGNDRCIVAEVVVWACVRHMLGVRQGHKRHKLEYYKTVVWRFFMYTNPIFGIRRCSDESSS